MTVRTKPRALALLAATSLALAPLAAFAQSTGTASSTDSPAAVAPLAAPPPATVTAPNTAIPEKTAPALNNSSAGITPGAATPAPARIAPQASATTTPSTAQPTTAKGKRVNALVESRIRDLHTRLHITAAQQQQWDNFTSVMRENAASMDDFYASHGSPATLTATEDLQNYASMAQLHDQNLQRLVPAFDQLYASFSPDQKRAADEAFRQFNQEQRRTTAHS